MLRLLGLDQPGVLATAFLVFLGTLAVLAAKGWWDARQLQREADKGAAVGEVTAAELAKYDGRDPFLPLLFAVRGRVFDVTKGRDFYGPGGGYAVFAGKEVSRALATMSLKPEDCCGDLGGLSEKQLRTLAEWEAKFEAKYPVAGKVVAPVELTLEQLRAYDGSDASKPIYLAIRGTVFDVSTGRAFYGPDGIYPFAGRECARAFALLSTDTADCVADLEGLGPVELDSLRDWQAKFYAKYRIVGSVKSVKS